MGRHSNVPGINANADQCVSRTVAEYFQIAHEIHTFYLFRHMCHKNVSNTSTKISEAGKVRHGLGNERMRRLFRTHGGIRSSIEGISHASKPIKLQTNLSPDRYMQIYKKGNTRAVTGGKPGETQIYESNRFGHLRLGVWKNKLVTSVAQSVGAIQQHLAMNYNCGISFEMVCALLVGRKLIVFNIYQPKWNKHCF